MQKNQRPIDLSYRPSPWLRGIAVALIVSSLSVGAVAGGRKEIPPPPAEPRTPIEIQDDAQTDSTANVEPEAQQQPGTSLPEGAIIEETDRPVWALVFHPTIASLQTEINEMIAQRYKPVGMEVASGGVVTILYELTEDDTPYQWLLEDYTAETINDEITSRLLAGWLPIGFSVVNETFFVLYAPGEGDVAAWRIHQTPLDSEAIPGIIRNYREQGYEFVDFSLEPSSDEMWYLFLERESSNQSDAPLFVDAYPNGETTAAGISVDYEAGRGMPDSIASGSQISVVVFRQIQVGQ